MSLLRRTPTAFHLARLRRSYHDQPSKLTIGIRREDPQRIWERRCPLTPEAVHHLVKNEDVDVLVQPCERRVWRMEQLLEAGARPHPTLKPAHVVLGIKETPIPELKELVDPLPLAGHEHPVARTHLMFSHTHKGQAYNMVLLNQFLSPNNQETKPRLIDYELLTDEQGKRTVGFGWFAGVAGALESLSALAHALLEQGIASPFLSTPRPHMHPSLSSVLNDLHKLVGDRIANEGTPHSLGPVVICVTGTGKVADGALDLLKHLPVEYIRVEDLPSLVADPGANLHKIYVVHALPRDYFVRKDGQPYERGHYYSHPDVYESVFHTKVAPYITLLLNGVGWAKGYPRLMTNAQLKTALELARTNGLGIGRFACVGDISCDVEGGLEFLPRHSTLSEPFFRTRPPSLPAHLPDVTMMAVDILPTALPREASEHFSNVLMPYLRTVIRGYREGGLAQGDRTGEALERATVASEGKLREPHIWLENPLGKWRAEVTSKESGTTGTSAAGQGVLRKKRVLMFGSGMVAGPAINEIVRRGDVQLTVASNVLQEAERLTQGQESASAVFVDMNNHEQVTRLVEQADLVVSLLPVPLHPAVADLCVMHRKHLVTASYISPAMRSLHADAVAADVVLLNEVGLDPGIDHCSAISLLSTLKEQGKRIRSFTSFCGGLPAPEHAEGIPLKYKFSWSPRGVLSAALNGARFKLWNKMYEIQGQDILKEIFPTLPASEVLQLEGIANRDSLPYADTYELGSLSELRTVLRGTIRYPGFSSLMQAFKSIGLLQTDILVAPKAWSDLTRTTLQSILQRPIPDDISAFIPPDYATDEVWEALNWLGIVSDAEESLPIPLPREPSAPIDLFAAVLAYKLLACPGRVW
ncbi:hypothetical protein NM688_g7045 [Phlebia brevispora]|uniref:Uncharacterized protein n=1 Tax=Phlebia brevispora TaxID=194682 RepID=A0ACC1S9J2_9APHY|nr:hypothetical protein NM688_g7045 [Phlebia brevispora]